MYAFTSVSSKSSSNCDVRMRLCHIWTPPHVLVPATITLALPVEWTWDTPYLDRTPPHAPVPVTITVTEPVKWIWDTLFEQRISRFSAGFVVILDGEVTGTERVDILANLVHPMEQI
ncbi:hypothetical protein AVEN_273885-1 [Araneus ventricosus]|uniref:Uncharacterized protein n=1 Tax=Araneus ventricosus TaxID=182803 RepID=A0A4Y2GR05_ARAVE|nr:hypothetical protein AVEN_273885-1 [Araneus ventricosus]